MKNDDRMLSASSLISATSEVGCCGDVFQTCTPAAYKGHIVITIFCNIARVSVQAQAQHFWHIATGIIPHHVPISHKK